LVTQKYISPILMKKLTALLIIIPFILLGCQTAQTEAPQRTPLLLISIDGLRPMDLASTDTPGVNRQ